MSLIRNPIDKQTNITGTVVYKYDDVNNIVTQKRRLNSDPLNFKEVVTKELLDGLGQVRADSMKTDLKVNNKFIYELKGTNTYNSDGKVLTHTDGEGRTITNGYDFLQRLIFQTNGDGIAKHMNYIIQPDTIKNGSYPAIYSEYTKSTDEIGKEVYTYYDKVGNKVAEKVGTNAPTIFQYDSLYRLSKVISPNNNIRSYYYDELGNLKQKNSPADEGTTLYKYDKYKRLRFTMNSAAPAYERGITFTKYDQFGRVLFTGTLPSNYGWESLLADNDYSINPVDQYHAHFENYQTDTSNFVRVNMYDNYIRSGVFSSLPSLSAQSIADMNLKGKLAVTAYRDRPGQAWNYKVYFYDYLGRIRQLSTKILSSWRTIYNSHDHLGNLTSQNIHNSYYLWYNYDIQGRLTEVRSNNTNDSSSSVIEASYAYDATDQVTNLDYGKGSLNTNSMSYSYDPSRGWLTNIQDKNNRFMERLKYYSNGNVDSMIVNNLGSGSWPVLKFKYTYDDRNQLLNSYSSSNAYNESLAYDNDGNILSYITPNKYFMYDYLTNSGQRTNLLSIVKRPSGIPLYQYSFDYKGNYISKKDLSNQPIQQVNSYDYRNLPLEMSIPKSSISMKFRYDDQGNRVNKMVFGNGTCTSNEYYLRDHLGRELAIFDISNGIRLKSVNLFGNGLIGRVEIQN